MTNRNTQRKMGFTLVELLVTMVIVGVLMGMLFPAITGAIRKGKKNQAEGDVRAIVTAWQQYYAEYGRWPVSEGRFMRLGGFVQNGGEAGQSFAAVDGIKMSEGVLESIMYPDASLMGKSFDAAVQSYNPKRLQLMERKQSDVLDMLDPWGNTYRFLLDVNGDGKVQWDPGGGADLITVYTPCIAWSMGPDGERNTGDDVRSW